MEENKTTSVVGVNTIRIGGNQCVYSFIVFLQDFEADCLRKMENEKGTRNDIGNVV